VNRTTLFAPIFDRSKAQSSQARSERGAGSTQQRPQGPDRAPAHRGPRFDVTHLLGRSRCALGALSLGSLRSFSLRSFSLRSFSLRSFSLRCRCALARPRCAVAALSLGSLRSRSARCARSCSRSLSFGSLRSRSLALGPRCATGCAMAPFRGCVTGCAMDRGVPRVCHGPRCVGVYHGARRCATVRCVPWSEVCPFGGCTMGHEVCHGPMCDTKLAMVRDVPRSVPWSEVCHGPRCHLGRGSVGAHLLKGSWLGRRTPPEGVVARS